MGELFFQFVDGYSIHVWVFRAAGYEGEPAETEEAIPLWFATDEIPYDEMWADGPDLVAPYARGGAFSRTFSSSTAMRCSITKSNTSRADRNPAFRFRPPAEPARFLLRRFSMKRFMHRSAFYRSFCYLLLLLLSVPALAQTAQSVEALPEALAKGAPDDGLVERVELRFAGGKLLFLVAGPDSGPPCCCSMADATAPPLGTISARYGT